jgi:hypothetical protein
MIKTTHTVIVVGSSLALALALAIGTSIPARAAGTAADKPALEGTMAPRCRQMQDQTRKMMSDMKAQDAGLAVLAVKMNGAPQTEKVALLAVMVTQMVEQRTTMDAHMEQMHRDIMQHIMQHMQMGKDSMAQCPMMKDMDDQPRAAP